MTYLRRASTVALIAFVLAGCEEGKEPAVASPVRWDTAQVVIRGAGSARLLVEVSKTEAQHTYGLMARPSLDPESGMIFLYDSVQAGDRGYWMFRTKMPLDIAFMDSTGVIARILTMPPCESELYADACPTYRPEVRYKSTLEVNEGWFGRHGVALGDTVVLEPKAAP
jgi:uncharacterized protein